MKNSLIIICSLLLTIQLQAQDVSEINPLKFKLKQMEGVVLIIDGKKHDPEMLELLDQSKIASVTVVKDEQAKLKYNAPNGVIIIKSKKDPDKTTQNVPPLYILNGKNCSKEDIAKLDPNDIDSVEVYKGEKAIELYNAPQGVIVIKTKK